MSHLTPDQLSAYVDQALDEAEREAAEQHLATCMECLHELADVARLQRELEHALVRDPGDAYFETFADRVRARIAGEPDASRAPVVPAAPERESGRAHRSPPWFERWGAWLSGPRLAWAGTVAAVIVGAGVVFMVSRESPVQSFRKQDLAARTGQVSERNEAGSRAAVPGLGKDGAQSEASLDDESAVRPMGPSVSPQVAGSQEADRVGAKPSAMREDADAKRAPAEQRANTAPAGPAGSTFAASPDARAREVKREEGESVPVPERGARETGAANLAPPAQPPQAQDAVGRAKAQQTRQTTQPLQSSALGRVCGYVRDHQRRPLAGAQVAITDLGLVVRADQAGRFCVEAPAGTHTLMVMAVGFVEARRQVTIGAATQESDFMLAAVPVLGEAAALRTTPTVWPGSVRDQAQDAERLTRRAQSARASATWDSAALAWSKTAAALPSGEPAVRALANLAEARYQAWKLSPTPGRKGVAASALQAYLEVAPAGPDKQLAQARLAEVGGP